MSVATRISAFGAFSCVFLFKIRKHKPAARGD